MGGVDVTDQQPPDGPEPTALDPADIRDAAAQLRAVLAAIEEDGSELRASAATRHRIEGAALALEQMAD